MKVLRILTILIFAFAVIILAPCVDADDQGVLLYEVNVYGDDEGVSLHNYGSTDVDLIGYAITDNPSKDSNEGIISFDSHLIIRPGETLTFADKAVDGSYFLNRHTTYLDGDTISVSSNFALKNSGDDVYLFKGNTVIDSFIYGSATVTYVSEWSGQSFDARNGFFAERKDPGLCQASAWYNMRPGITEQFFDPELRVDATVTPFLFPEHGGIPIYEALSKAEESVYLDMYTLTSDNVIALLCDLARKGVEVNVLIPSSTSDYNPLKDGGKLKALSDAGADIRLQYNTERYVYVHAKCCIIDEKTTIITSENWTLGNLNGKVVTDPLKGEGNRGWGIVIESPQFSAYMRDLFLVDFDDGYGDVKHYDQLSTDITPKTLTYRAPTDTVSLDSYRTEVTPLVSPDSSRDGMTYYISNATERVYTEQQSLGSYLLSDGYISPFSAVVERCKAGVDTKMILSTNVDQDDVSAVRSFGIQTGVLTTPYVHNKGIICDDTVLIGSVNWTDNSFLNNRETMVAVHSEAVADYYAKSFQSDFAISTKDTGLTVTFSEPPEDVLEGNDVTVTASVKEQGNFTYSWVLDGTPLYQDIARISICPASGDHIISVTVTDAQGNVGMASDTFTVRTSGLLPDIGDIDTMWLYALPIILVLVAASVAAFRFARGR